MSMEAEESDDSETDTLETCSFFDGKETILKGIEDTVQQLPMERLEDTHRRSQAFLKCLNTIDKKIDDIISTRHEEMIQNLLKFITKAKEKLDKLHGTAESAEQEELPIKQKSILLLSRPEVSTGILVTGANMSDHQLLFKQLLAEIKNHITPHVLLLKAGECNPGMKATMKCLLTQLDSSVHQDFGEYDSTATPRFQWYTPRRAKWDGDVIPTTPRSSRTRPTSRVSQLAENTTTTCSVKILRTPPRKRRPSDSAGTPNSSRKRRPSDSAGTPNSSRKRRPADSVGTPNSAQKRRPAVGTPNSPGSLVTPRKRKLPPSAGDGVVTPVSKRRLTMPTSGIGTPRSRRRVPLCSMTTMCGLYQESLQIDETRPPVVVVVENFEEFSPNILQDFILSIGPHLAELPLVLVLGMASLTSFHQTLPHHVTSLLSVQQFHTQPPEVTLTHIVNEVQINPTIAFKLGYQSLNFLLQHFFCFNFSLTRFRRGLKFALMEHFYWQPLSVLCDFAVLGSKYKMTHGVCEAVRATPSFQRYVEEADPTQRIHLLSKDSAVQTKVKEMVTTWVESQWISHTLLRCLHHFTCNLPNQPLGSKFRELYCCSLEKNIVEQTKFVRAWMLVNLLSKDRLCAIVTLCIEELKQVTANTPHRHVMKDILTTFTGFLQEVKILDETINVTEDTVDKIKPSKQKVSFHERLKQMASRCQAQPDAFITLRNNFLFVLLEIFTDHLNAPISLPLHEAFYFDQVESLRKHLAPAPRAAIQTALANPCYYLRPSGDQPRGRTQDEDIEIPDICAVYSLYLESGKFIKRTDWLQSFVAAVQPDARIVKEEGGKQEIDPAIQARFDQAMSELQFLGFIKETQRKNDHLQRLTWTC